MRKLILISGIIFVMFISCAAQTRYTDDSFIDGWSLQFWQLHPLQGSYTVVFPGDTIKIQFDQALRTISESSQPQWGIGDTTGIVDSLYIPLSQATRVYVSDSLITYSYTKSISLLPGAWALVIKTKGVNSMYSRHSKPYWFNVVSLPPDMPVEVKLIIFHHN